MIAFADPNSECQLFNTGSSSSWCTDGFLHLLHIITNKFTYTNLQGTMTPGEYMLYQYDVRM